MAGENKEISAEIGHVDSSVDNRLRTVNERVDIRVVFFSYLDDLFDRIDGAEGIRDMHKGNHLRLWG